MKVYFTFCLIILITTLCFSQDRYTDIEKEAFVEIYMSNKGLLRVNRSANISNSLSKYKMDKSRYQEILNTSLKGEDIDLSESEQKFIKEIKNKSIEIENQKRLNVEQSCLEKKLSYTRYRQLLSAFKAEIKIQNELKPFFQRYILKHGK